MEEIHIIILKVIMYLLIGLAGVIMIKISKTLCEVCDAVECINLLESKKQELNN